MASFLNDILAGKAGAIPSVLYVPQLEWLVRTVPLSGSDLLLCLAVASSVLVVSEVDKLAMRRFGRRPSRMP